MIAIEMQGFETIRPANVVDYLRAHGWQGVESKRTDLAVFRRDTPAGVVETRVLLDETFGDFLVRMSEVVDTISRMEARPVPQVVNDLLAPPGDHLRFRIDSENTESGTLGLAQSIQLRKALRNMLLSAAHSAIAPAPHYARLTQAKALDLVNECRERQSERGSYVASILVPVLPPVGQLSIEEEFGRRTTRILFTALQTAERAAATPDHLMEASASGISANFLEALAELEPSGQRAAVEVTVNWLGSAPSPELSRRVRLPQGAFRNFRSVAKALREASPLPNTELEGYVIAVSKDLGASIGWATIAAQVEPFGDSRVRIEVDQEQHVVVAGAHALGQRVRVVGTLKKSIRTLELVEHSAVEVLPAES